MRFQRLLPFFLALTCIVAPALAQDADDTSDWGLRVGLGSDPDQLVGGVNFLETKFANHVYLVPNAELGVGDDHLIIAATAPVHYRFDTSTQVTPYVGGGVTLGFDRHDRPQGDDTDFEIALQISGGVIFPLKSGAEMFGELDLSSGDFWDIKAMVGWRF